MRGATARTKVVVKDRIGQTISSGHPSLRPFTGDAGSSTTATGETRLMERMSRRALRSSASSRQFTNPPKSAFPALRYLPSRPDITDGAAAHSTSNARRPPIAVRSLEEYD